MTLEELQALLRRSPRTRHLSARSAGGKLTQIGDGFCCRVWLNPEEALADVPAWIPYDTRLKLRITDGGDCDDTLDALWTHNPDVQTRAALGRLVCGEPEARVGGGAAPECVLRLEVER